MGKKLFLITDSFPYGFAESFLETELIFLSQKFENVYIIPNNRSKGSPRTIDLENVIVLPPLYTTQFISIIRIVFNFIGFTFIFDELKSILLRKTFKGTLHCIFIGLKTRAYAKLIDSILVKYGNHDDLLLYFYWGNIPANSSIILARNYKIVVRFHGGDLYEELPVYKGKIHYRKMLIESASLNVFISNYGYFYAKVKYKNIANKFIVSRLGVLNCGLSRKSNDGVLRILTCSNVTQNKRLELLIEALNCMKNSIIWTHIGNGPLFDVIQEKSKSLPKNVKTKFVGNVSNDEVRRFYLENMVDIFINVSVSEGVPVTIMEALSSGVPIIATDVGGTNEIVDSFVGFLVKETISCEELSRLLIQFYELNDTKKDQYRANAFERFMKMSDASKQYNEFADCLVDLIDKDKMAKNSL